MKDPTGPIPILTKLLMTTSLGGETTLELTANLSDDEPRPDVLHAEIVRHDDIEVHWWATVPCQEEGKLWRGSLPTEASQSPRLIEVIRVRTPVGSDVNVVAESLFLEPDDLGDWTTGERAEEERDRLRTARQARFDQQLVAKDSGTDASEFMVVMLIDNLYLTREQRIPGVRVQQLQRATLGSDQAQILNAVMVQLGFRSGLDLGDWLQAMSRQRPAAVLIAPRVVAASPEDAHQEARRVAHLLLDLFAFRRGATPRLLCGVVGVPAGERDVTCVGSWIEGPGYTGNLLGGFISGEDRHSLLADWGGLTADPRTRLWLSLFADALADERWDYQLFRFFNLLEGIGAEVIPDGQTLRDPQGQVRLQENGKPYTTSHARGRVFSLLSRVAATTNEAETNFTASRPTGTPVTLWEEVGVWVSVRNAVAHRGTWSIAEDEQPSPHHAGVEAEITSRSHDGTLDAGVRQVLRGIRSGVESTLRAALRQSLNDWSESTYAQGRLP